MCSCGCQCSCVGDSGDGVVDYGTTQGANAGASAGQQNTMPGMSLKFLRNAIAELVIVD